MRIIIAGDRNITDYKIVKSAVEAALKSWNCGTDAVDEVVSGCARGIDTLGEKWAETNGVKVVKFPAKWDKLDGDWVEIKVNKWGKKYNSKAGFIRNQQMAEYATHLIAIQTNGPTNGTQSMIRLGKKYNLIIYEVEKPESEYKYNF